MRSLKGLIWRLRGGDKRPPGSLLQRLLLRRGVSLAEAAAFLVPRLADINPPFAFREMAKAVEILQESGRRRRKVFIYVVYDADGVVSSVILAERLRGLNLSPLVYLPERLKEGYGLKLPVLKKMVAAGGEVVITVDTGTAYSEEIEFLKKKKVQVVVLDHHEPKGKLPPADAILNPKLPQETYPFRELSSSGIAWQLSRALAKTLTGRWEEENLELAAIGTISDVVPLISDNRIIAKFGLERLSSSPRAGLRALRRLLALEGEELESYHVSHLIGPRLNAAGRLKHARLAYELLSATDLLEAWETAQELHQLNSLRQGLVEAILKEAEKEAQEQLNRKILLLAGRGWSVGVAGLVANRLAERFNRPAIVLEETGESLKGSGRSVPGVDLHRLVGEFSPLLESFGGHQGAIGLALKKANWAAFQRKLWQIASRLPDDLFRPVLFLDEELRGQDLVPELYAELSRLKPFGLGNEEPIFWLKGVRLKEAVLLEGQRGRHLKLLFEGLRLPGFWFGEGGQTERLRVGQAVEAAVSLERGFFAGHPVLRLKVHDLRLG